MHDFQMNLDRGFYLTLPGIRFFMENEMSTNYWHTHGSTHTYLCKYHVSGYDCGLLYRFIYTKIKNVVTDRNLVVSCYAAL